MTPSCEGKWEIVSLGALAEFRNGVNYSEKNFGKGMKVINVKDFQDYTFAKLDGLGEINPTGIVREKDLLKEEDILFVRSNGNRELIGRSVFVRGMKEEVSHSAFTIRGRFVSEKAYPRFFAYLFKSSLIRQTLSAFGGGTNISNLNQQILNSLQVPLPPLEAQHKIASVLSAYDDLIENNTRRIKILEEMAQTIYREWFVNFRFPGYEKVKMVDSPLGKIPEGWEVKTLGDVCSLIKRGISPKYDEASPSVVINQKCIRNFRINLTPSRRHIKKVPEDKYVQESDVLINSTGVGTLGRVAQLLRPIEDCTVDSHVTIVRCEDDIDHHFFGLQLFELQGHFERLAQGATGQTELSRQTVSDTLCLVAPRPLQEKFSTNVKAMRLLSIRLAEKNEKLRQTRDLLLPKLISGSIDVSDLEIEINAA